MTTMDLFAKLPTERLTAIVDIGAAALDESPPYAAMIAAKQANLLGFDPQFQLWRPENDNVKMRPEVIGDGYEAVLYRRRIPGMTGLYPLDEQVSDLFQGFTEWGKVVDEIPVQTTKLSNFKIPIDYLKIDAEGSELNILQNADIDDTVIIQVETFFLPLYRGMPLFRDLDQHLVNRGFVLNNFLDAPTAQLIKPFPKMSVYAGDLHMMRQELYKDAIYVRDYSEWKHLTDQQLRHLALIAHYALRSAPLCYRALMTLLDRGAIETTLVSEYMAALTRFDPAVIIRGIDPSSVHNRDSAIVSR